MLKVKVTENLGGVNICGNYDDLNYLYDSVLSLICYDTYDIKENLLQEHLYAFLYEVNNCYQSDKKFGESNNVYYNFNYFITDVVLDMIIIKYFIRNKERKEKDMYNSYINFLNYFYSLVMDSFEEVLSKIRFNKIKRGITDCYIDSYRYNHLWFEMISIDYIKMSKAKREKEFMHIMSYIYDYMEYKEYFDMKMQYEELSKNENYLISNYHFDDYPEEIIW